MSVQAISMALKVRGVSPSEKLLLLVLANFADEHNRSYPSHRRLADDTGLSERTILSAFKSLEAKKLVSRQERRRADGSRSSDLVTLHWHGEIISPRGANDVEGGEMVAGGGEAIAPLTTFEPSITQEGSNDPSLKTRPSKRCPDGFTPSEQTVRKLADEGYGPGDLERALAMVKDHKFRDAHTEWDSVFRNWVRRDRPQPRKPHVQSYPDQKYAARLDNFRAASEGAEAASRNRQALLRSG